MYIKLNENKKKFLISVIVNTFCVIYSNFSFYGFSVMQDIKMNSLFNAKFVVSNVVDIVPVPPKLKILNWEIILLPIIKQIFFISEIEVNSILLISKMKNATNGTLHTDRATTALKNIISQDDRFSIVTSDQLNKAYVALGLLWEDNLESCVTAISLGRYLGAKYLLYSIVKGDIKHPILELQLILVKTGEIIWLFKDVI
ncbi:hypothetical protein [Blochmannia endosymbiont of Camponotus (Colobopsis) obliquus]|uniref:hypothetical protein n=1 Tax=Blochmannia endosymbiont of Camponotus (Colobopsis) obliquus TaxID=1505597 RepID=UPI00061A651D|nr:hypothetical protein [Blochmannia endosymbiont of Camponotus (Colobopsis) obliquus]AKC60556.1 Penicillin-binding protein activator LpoB [Blochmannia endosymbiont of Camponotus (Colobopsis) obliquus]